MSDFKCPKCGGTKFGSTIDPVTHRIVERRCDSLADGRPMSMPSEAIENQDTRRSEILSRKGVKSCGYREKIT